MSPVCTNAAQLAFEQRTRRRWSAAPTLLLGFAAQRFTVGQTDSWTGPEARGWVVLESDEEAASRAASHRFLLENETDKIVGEDRWVGG